MKTVAIIAEYNPFHNGHLYQVNKIKELLCDEVAIIAIMSGNYTQRGEMAFMDKEVRSKCALDAGVDLVLELPFPYSMSSAEFFAKSGVKIANELGTVDYLAFGCEFDDPDKLYTIADNMLKPEYTERLTELFSDSEYREYGYPKLCEMAYVSCYGGSPEGIFEPNNILGLEYLKALSEINSNITPLPITRKGSGYNSTFINGEALQSAGAIRKMFSKNQNSALDYIPRTSIDHILRGIDNGSIPTDEALLDRAIISSFRLNPPSDKRDIHDAEGGLYNRLYENSFKANNISSLITMTETKKFTRARIRRAIWYAYFGVTSSEVRSLPAYTQVLAMNSVGRRVLREIKRVSHFPVITKPTALSDYSIRVIEQKNLSNTADSVFALARKMPINAKASLVFTPYVKE